MHSIVTEVPVRFEVFVLFTLRVESKASLIIAEVVIDAVTRVFAPAVLAPVFTRFHEISLVDESSTKSPSKQGNKEVQ